LYLFFENARLYPKAGPHQFPSSIKTCISFSEIKLDFGLLCNEIELHLPTTLKRFENKCYLFISITKENGSSFGEKKNAH
jgi:hypothetical protein